MVGSQALILSELILEALQKSNPQELNPSELLLDYLIHCASR